MTHCENINWVVDGLYIKQTIRNRCTILDANGSLDLVIPVQKANSKQLYRDVKISYQTNWVKQHIRALASAYGSSPFYYYYKDKIENILLNNYNFLIDLNLASSDMLFNIYKLKPTQSQIDQIAIELSINTFINPAQQKQEERKELIAMAATQQKYQQVFAPKFGFVTGLSIIDMLFNTDIKPYSQKVC